MKIAIELYEDFCAWVNTSQKGGEVFLENYYRAGMYLRQHLRYGIFSSIMNIHPSPLFEEISFLEALKFSTALNDYNNIVFFNSARLNDVLGRYSFIALDPFEQFIYESTEMIPDIFEQLAQKINIFKLSSISDLPPFQGGVAGYLSYDLVRDLEELPSYAIADIAYPKWVLGFYDVVLSIDHVQKKSWICSSGFPELDPDKRHERARERLQWLRSEIKLAKINKNINSVAVDQEDIISNFTESEYLSAVAKVKCDIADGEVFEVNISQRFQCALPEGLTPFQLYRRIAERNPAPFASYMRFDELAIVSSSPERFLKVSDNVVQARPIKGTVKRSKNIKKDEVLAQQLLTSEKNNAENAMIVDLMRNDLSRVCLPHSVAVPQLCQLESYENVHHLVSVVTGVLHPECDQIALLKATLAAGSVTGAPKIRALEIIDEIEPTRRGPYCGHALYLGFNGTMDSSLLIRTYVIFGSVVTFQGGGAVVLDSDPMQEYEETFTKVRTLMSALTL